jgi:formylglycine-generating enzyme required for sulfatase activity
MGKYEVTQKQWQAVMGTTVAQQANGKPLYGAGDAYPMYYVSWYDALVFCNKLSIMEGLAPAYTINGGTDPGEWGTVPTSSNSFWEAVTCDWGAGGYRLPTEAEWEYACRAGTTTAYYTGEAITNGTGWYVDNSGGQAHPAGQKQANACGLYDMAGNVWEWCWDWWGAYGDGSQTNPRGPSAGAVRVSRGGGWVIGGAELRSAFRYGSDPTFRSYIFGFRLVRP